MDWITIKDVPPYSGRYELDLEGAFGDVYPVGQLGAQSA